MAEKLDEMNFVSSTADPEVWLQPAIKSDGSEFCKCTLCCVDDILAISTDPGSILDGLKGGTVRFENEIETPEMHLRAKWRRNQWMGLVVGPSQVKSASKLQLTPSRLQLQRATGGPFQREPELL